MPHGRNSYPLPPPSEGLPLRARRQGIEMGLSGSAFGRIHGPLGSRQRSNPHTYVYHCIPFCMSYMHTKFQLSVLINNIFFYTWDPSAPSKGRLAAPWRVGPQIYISLDFNLYEQYAYQISASQLDKQKSSEYAIGVISRFLLITLLIENHWAPVLK